LENFGNFGSYGTIQPRIFPEVDSGKFWNYLDTIDIEYLTVMLKFSDFFGISSTLENFGNFRSYGTIQPRIFPEVGSGKFLDLLDTIDTGISEGDPEISGFFQNILDFGKFRKFWRLRDNPISNVFRCGTGKILEIPDHLLGNDRTTLFSSPLHHKSFHNFRFLPAYNFGTGTS